MASVEAATRQRCCSPLTRRQASFLNDGLWNFPAAGFLIPDGFAPHLLQVAVVAVAADEGLRLIEQLLEEHQVSLEAADGAEVIDLFQLKLRLQIFDLGLGSPELRQKAGRGRPERETPLRKERERRVLPGEECVRQREGRAQGKASVFGKVLDASLIRTGFVWRDYAMSVFMTDFSRFSGVLEWTFPAGLH